MKKQAILSPIFLSPIFLGLTLPTLALANVPTPSSPQSLNQEQLNTLETVEIAQRYQRYLSAQYVSSRLNNSESRILNIARGYSNEARWRRISVNQINDQRMRLNIYGTVPRRWPLKDTNIRIGLYLQRDRQGDFRFSQYDWEVLSGTCKSPCKNKIRSKLRNLPNEYPRFQQVLNRILS